MVPRCVDVDARGGVFGGWTDAGAGFAACVGCTTGVGSKAGAGFISGAGGAGNLNEGCMSCGERQGLVKELSGLISGVLREELLVLFKLIRDVGKSL